MTGLGTSTANRKTLASEVEKTSPLFRCLYGTKHGHQTCRCEAWLVPNRLDAVQSVRRVVGEALRGWGFDEASLADVLLLTSEVVTNALVHGQPDVTCTILGCEGCVTVSVVDHGDAEPRMPESPLDVDDILSCDGDDISLGGRGLALVHELADRMGWRRFRDGGKEVWFTCRVEQPGDNYPP